MKNLLNNSASMAQNSVAVLTTSRSEYYQVRPILRCLQSSESLSLQLFVSGSHLSAQFGNSLKDIEKDGFSPHEKLPIMVEDDSGLGCAVTAGLAVQMIAGALDRNATDVLLLMGDRYEMLAAALAATCVGVPIVHVHGGERTDGVLDDSCRHAITKLSSLHFVSTDVYRARVIQMGESPDRVFTVGAPLVDELMTVPLLTEPEVAGSLKLDIEHPLALVAYHPVTREKDDDGKICRLIMESVSTFCNTVIATAPNSDPGNRVIFDVMKAFAQKYNHVKLFTNLGSQRFLSLMSCAELMIGNSSSGIHEAASFKLPVVNVGSRQTGRLRPLNVVDCEPEVSSINKAVSLSLSAEFRR
ncbi:MAG: UDP-N-acetylglucosamine 2-epimerase (hydrolyzing), partial [Candidatus Brocadiia bacterium]